MKMKMKMGMKGRRRVASSSVPTLFALLLTFFLLSGGVRERSVGVVAQPTTPGFIISLSQAGLDYIEREYTLSLYFSGYGSVE